MSIDHRGFNLRMAEQFLDLAEVHSLQQKVGGKGVPKAVHGGVLANTGFIKRCFDGALQSAFAHMMPADNTACGFDPFPLCRPERK